MARSNLAFFIGVYHRHRMTGLKARGAILALTLNIECLNTLRLHNSRSREISPHHKHPPSAEVSRQQAPPAPDRPCSDRAIPEGQGPQDGGRPMLVVRGGESQTRYHFFTECRAWARQMRNSLLFLSSGDDSIGCLFPLLCMYIFFEYIFLFLTLFLS